MNNSSITLRACLLALLPAALSAQEVLQLDPFTVTAQKRVESIRDVPIPLTAYVGSFLEQAGVTDYKGLAPLVSGLFIQEQSPNNPGISLRGITTDSGDPRSEARVSIFQDGVSISRSRASVVELFDLQRVEVLKGPQGTLFGRGAEIGAISLIQNKARNETSGMLSLGFGSHNEVRLSGYYNAPLAADTLFGRVAFAYAKHDGTVDNLADGSDLNGKDTSALRGAFRWQPSQSTTVDLILNWQHDQPPGTGFKSGVIPTSLGDTDHFTAAELNRGSILGVNRTVWGATGIIEHTFNDTWSMTSITGGRSYDSYEDFDADGSRIFLLEFAEDAGGRQFSQELRFNFADGGRFTGFVGAGYFHETGTARVPFYTDERQLWPFLNGPFRANLLAAGLPAAFVNFAVPALNPFVPQATLPLTFAAFASPGLPPQLRGLAALAGAPLQGYRADEYTQSSETTAVDAFIDGTWQVTDRLDLTAGLRLTREKQTSGYEAHNSSPPPTLGFIVNNIPGYPYLPTNGLREAGASNSSWDGRLIAKYEVSQTLNTYASVARGHRPQSVLVDSTSTTVAQEEEVWNYEAGLKGSLAGGRVQWQASAFQYDYAHFQTTVLSLGSFKVLDVGNATGRGMEFGLLGAVSDHVSLFANYSYTDATFDETGDDGQPQQYAGYALRLSPRNMLSLGATFTLPRSESGQFYITPVYQYKSQHYFEDNNASFNYGLSQDGFSVVNLRAGWRSPKGRWEATAYASNLFDEDFLIDAGNVGGSFGIPTFVAGHPRRIGLEFSRRW